MNRISGSIVRDDTKQGISDVIVVLYDVDISNPNQGNPESRFEPSSSLVQQYLQLIYGGRDAEEDQEIRQGQMAADRLGSVLTGSNGHFELEFDDEAFRVNDAEARPDLVLLVVAPDRQGALINEDSIYLSVGTPEYMRIMHLSILPVRNAGRQEQVIIRIPPAVLRRFNVDATADSTRPFVSAMAGAEKKRIALNSLINRQLGLRDKALRQEEIKEATDRFAVNVSGISSALRASPLFVSNGDSPEEASRVALRRGVDRIRPHGDSRTTAAHLRLSEEDLRALGITNLGIESLSDLEERLRDTGITLPLNTEQFCERLQEKVGGTELVRVTSLLDEQRAEAAARQEQLNAPDTPEEDGEEEEEPESPLSPEELIRERVLKEVEAMGEDPTQTAGAEDQQSSIRSAFELLKPPASPADVTAFHDFHHLQIAFPDVWAEAFDRDVSDIIRSLYIEYREFNEETGNDEDDLLGLGDIDPEALLDINEYTTLLRNLGASVVSLGESVQVPAEVVRFWNEMNRVGSFEEQKENVIQNRMNLRLQEQKDAVNAGKLFTQKASTIAPSTDIHAIWLTLSVEQQQELFELATVPDPQTLFEQTLDIASNFQERVHELLAADNTEKIKLGMDLMREARLPRDEDQQPGLTLEERYARARFIISNPAGRISRVQRLLAGLAQRLSEPYSFRVFQKNSVNFGIVSTYRQEWNPGDYQVGSLVGTVPLAPGEKRKYTTSNKIKKSLSQKRNDRYSTVLSDERAITSRLIADILEKASTETDFEQTLKTKLSGTIKAFTLGVNTSTTFQKNQSVESQRIKKQFHEAIRKASQEIKDEHALEISTESASEFETGSVSEIHNPNNEIAVTYLFYELERQYRVTERLHKLTPVILVAQEVPEPSDIDDDWLIAHAWILRRSLLDSSFEPVLDIVSEGLVQDEVTLELARRHFETQKLLVDTLSESVDSLSTLQETLRNTLVQTSEQEKLARIAKRKARRRRRRRFFGPPLGRTVSPGRLSSGSSLLTFGNRGESADVLEARREALETRLEFLEGTLSDERSRLTRATSVLEKATEELAVAIEDSFTRRTQVNQLRVHIKDNILHYMQAIWSYEKPDQRYFRLYDLPVNVPGPETDDEGNADFVLTPRSTEEIDGFYPSWVLGRFDLELPIRVTLPPPGTPITQTRLHQVADLDNLLGFKGNYMIFPLLECTYITDFMMQDYVDDYFGVRDPDPVSSFSTEELLQYAEQIWHDERTSEATREALNALILQRLTSVRNDDDLIVIPTGQLFIEALKGEHVLLEHFKQQHRALDVLKVQEEVRMERLESLRKAYRLILENPLLHNPDEDKRVEVNGDADADISV